MLSNPLLIHYHIFKNAGTSFEWALEQALGAGLKHYDTPTPGGFVSADDLVRFIAAYPDTRAIASHQAAPPPPRVPGRHILSSILIRDPLARIRSIYAFERKQVSESPGAIKAKELDFKGYVEWRLAATPRAICNYQVHFCCRDRAKSGRLPADRSDLTKAISHLDRIDIVGTVERYEEWLRLAESILSANFDPMALTSVRHNQTAAAPGRSEAAIHERLVADLGSALADQLVEENELDMCLHQVADSILTRRLAERSILIRLRDAYDKVRAGQGVPSESSEA